LGTGAERVRDVSVGRAPTRTTALRASARTVQEPGSGTAVVTFDADYAVYQHDDAGPKFLETALVSARRAVARLLQAEIRAALR
jgi:hypothetical protein